MPFSIVRNDITKMNVDAVVNAAQPSLTMGGGVCGAIFSAAGPEKLREECRRLRPCAIGNAVITGGYDLPAKFIIHTVGPVWSGVGSSEERLLESCYTASLNLAQKNGCKSIAFPLISSGIYGYPKAVALNAAVSAIRSFLADNEMEVYLVVYNNDSYEINSELFHSIRQYIDDKCAGERAAFYRNIKVDSNKSFYKKAQRSSGAMAAPQPPLARPKAELDDIVARIGETFSQMLMRLIDERGYNDVEVYKKANIDRRLFSKMRGDKDYKPSKPTALALAVALRLDMDDTNELLRKAGFALSHSSKFDIIIEYFIERGEYDIYEINEALFAFDQPLLGV